MAQANALDIYKDRKNRTVNIYIERGTVPVDRYDFAAYVDHTVGASNLVAFGPTADRGIYQLTFKTENHVKQFCSYGDFFIKERACKIESSFEKEHKIKIHWLPYYIPDQVIISELEKIPGLKVIHGWQEHSAKEGLKHVLTNVRVYSVRISSLEYIPQFVYWSYQKEKGKVLVVVPDKPPLCLRCHCSGHYRRECTTAYCIACKNFGHSQENCVEFPVLSKSPLHGKEPKSHTEDNPPNQEYKQAEIELVQKIKEKYSTNVQDMEISAGGAPPALEAAALQSEAAATAAAASIEPDDIADKNTDIDVAPETPVMQAASKEDMLIDFTLVEPIRKKNQENISAQTDKIQQHMHTAKDDDNDVVDHNFWSVLLDEQDMVCDVGKEPGGIEDNINPQQPLPPKEKKTPKSSKKTAGNTVTTSAEKISDLQIEQVTDYPMVFQNQQEDSPGNLVIDESSPITIPETQKIDTVPTEINKSSNYTIETETQQSEDLLDELNRKIMEESEITIQATNQGAFATQISSFQGSQKQNVNMTSLLTLNPPSKDHTPLLEEGELLEGEGEGEKATHTQDDITLFQKSQKTPRTPPRRKHSLSPTKRESYSQIVQTGGRKRQPSERSPYESESPTMFSLRKKKT